MEHSRSPVRNTTLLQCSSYDNQESAAEGRSSDERWGIAAKERKERKEVGRKSRRANGWNIQTARVRAGFEPFVERLIVEDSDRIQSHPSMIDSKFPGESCNRDVRHETSHTTQLESAAV